MDLEQEAIKLVQSGRISVTPHRLIELHKALIGDKPAKWYCATCPGKLNMVFTDLKLKYYQHIKPMAKSEKYTWNKNFKGIQIADASYPHLVTEETLTDKHAEALLKLDGGKRYGHIIQPVKAAAEPKAEAKKEATTKPNKSTEAGK